MYGRFIGRAYKEIRGVGPGDFSSLVPGLEAAREPFVGVGAGMVGGLHAALPADADAPV